MLDFIIVPESLHWSSFYGLIIISCLTSMLTASIGIGGGMLMLAIIAQLMPVKAIIPIHAVVQVGSNAGRAMMMLKDVCWQYFFWFALGSLLGALIGGQLLINLPIGLLQLCLGLFILFTVWGPSFVSKIANNKTLLLGGAISTFLTMFVGATGPLVVAIIRAFKLPRFKLVATSAACLVLQHALKILAFGVLGFNFSPYLVLVILMIFSGFIGTLIGKRMLVKVDEQRFQSYLNIILTILALRLLVAAMF